MKIWCPVLLIALFRAAHGLIYEDWLPDDLETCLIDRTNGVTPETIPPYSILYTCVAHHLARLRANKQLINGPTENDFNWYKHLGRKLNKMMYEHKRYKRDTPPAYQINRRDIRTLSSKELKDYVTAVKALKDEGRYDAITNLHQGNAILAGHFGPGFLSYHRILLFIFQIALWEKNPSVGLPYCDTSIDHNMAGDPVNSILLSNKYFGNPQGIVVSGPFANWNTPANVTLQRNAGISGSLMTETGYQEIMKQKHTRDIIVNTSPANLESQHNNVHVFYGGLMGDLNYSPCDPIFFCHHTYIDYLWQKFRQRQGGLNIDPSKDFPSVGDEWHQPNRNIPKISSYLKVNVTHMHIYHEMFAESFYVHYVDSPKYPNCGNYQDILKDDVRKVCYSKSTSKGERSTVNVLQGTRTNEGKQKFKITNGFKSSLTDPRIKSRNTRSVSFPNRDNTRPISESPMDLTIQNDFQIDGDIDETKWGFLPVRVVYKRSPDVTINTNTAKYQRIMEEIAEHKKIESFTDDDSDLYNAHAYPKLWKKIRSRHQAIFDKPRVQKSGAYRLMVEATGFSYTGKYTDYVIVDERQPVSESVAYIGIKRPYDGKTEKAFITAFDPDGSVCEARCLVRGSNPPIYKRCSGVIKINSKEPKMYGDNLGDAYLMRYRFQGDDLPNSHDQDIFLMFFCDYGVDFPWKETYKRK